MKVLYIHQYFRTPAEGGSIRSYNLAKKLVASGVSVEVITTHNAREAKTVIIDGVKVHYLAIPYDNKFGYLRRLGAFLKFVALAIMKSHQIKAVDICYIMTTPLSTGFLGLYNKWIRNIPYIFEIGDLWPEVPIQMGVIKNASFKWLLYKLEKLFYKQAKGIVALSTGIAFYINKIVPNKRIEVIPNIADCNFFRPIPKSNIIKLKYDIQDEFVISYTGTLGVANHLKYLLDAAKSSMHLNIKYIIVGDGAEKSKLVNYALKLNLVNVSFYPSIDKKGIKEILNISNAIFLSFQNNKVLHTGSPNKLFDGLAAGKIIISNLQGWSKDLIEQNELGIFYNPEHSNEFVEKIEALIKDEKSLKEYQKNARRLAEKEFSLKILSNKQLSFIKSLE